MKSKSSKSLAKDSKSPGRAADLDLSRHARVTDGKLRPVRKASDNLRQRAEWFQRRRREK
jgi:hypothetical protein